MENELDAKQIGVRGVFDEYRELVESVEKTDILTILELLTALRQANDDVEKRDRLSQTIAVILKYSPWNKPQGLASMGSELLDSIKDRDHDSLRRLFDAMSALPLAWTGDPHYRYFAKLDGKELKDLIEVLTKQTAFRKILGGRIVIIRIYLQICDRLLEICELNQEFECLSYPGNELALDSIWRSFLVSDSQLGDIHASYCTIVGDTHGLSLPLIPFLEIGDGMWLISKELITDAMLRAFVNLLRQACGELPRSQI